MKRCLTILIMLSLTCAVMAQEKESKPNELMQSVEEWMRENLDENVLQALDQIDQDRVLELFNDLQRRFAGTDVYDLSGLKETATRLLPLLHQFDETRPYGIWLETHLDYLDAAEELRRAIKPTPVEPGRVAPLPSPSAQLQRSVWNNQLAKRSLPPLGQASIPQLKQIFGSEKIPPQLVWVAEVESSFNPRARSPKGAAGLFQLMPATARDLGLSVRPLDERLQPEKSARAAAKYLRYLHGRFGDWRLALAAYNAGETRVDDLLKQHKAQTFDAIAPRLPAETQMFVPKVEATLRKREGYALADL